MNPKFLLFLSLLLIGWWYFRPPSASNITDHTDIDVKSGTIIHRQQQYHTQWGAEITHSGLVRYTGRAFHQSAPFITNDAVITTGDYSNPELVKVPPLRHGTTVIRYKLNVKLEGSIIVLHFIPQDRTVLKALSRIKNGDRVRLTGREEQDHTIEGPDGPLFKVFHTDVHRLFLVTNVHRIEDER